MSRMGQMSGGREPNEGYLGAVGEKEATTRQQRKRNEGTKFRKQNLGFGRPFLTWVSPAKCSKPQTSEQPAAEADASRIAWRSPCWGRPRGQPLLSPSPAGWMPCLAGQRGVEGVWAGWSRCQPWQGSAPARLRDCGPARVWEARRVTWGFPVSWPRLADEAGAARSSRSIAMLAHVISSSLSSHHPTISLRCGISGTTDGSCCGIQCFKPPTIVCPEIPTIG